MTTEAMGMPATGAANLLGLAAAPAFAIMALLTALPTAAPMLDCGMHGASPLGGMAWMYLLMTAFHTPPWLRLLARRQQEGCNNDNPFNSYP